MATRIIRFLRKYYPQNIIIKKPFLGMVLFSLLAFVFLLVYKPTQVSKSPHLSFEATMGVYCLGSGFVIMLLIYLFKRINYFSNSEKWNLIKELEFTVFILLGCGIFVYFLAFFVEVSSSRWNLITFCDSIMKTFLVGIIPFSFFTILNYRFLFYPEMTEESGIQKTHEMISPSQEEDKIEINSKLKKESLCFYPSQFVFAVSNGNYVDFYLVQENKTCKKTIRNSILDIEKQLSQVPFIIKTHRAFIINLKRIQKKQGNASGYRLIVSGTDMVIPVSRQNTLLFDEKWKQYLE